MSAFSGEKYLPLVTPAGETDRCRLPRADALVAPVHMRKHGTLTRAVISISADIPTPSTDIVLLTDQAPASEQHTRSGEVQIGTGEYKIKPIKQKVRELLGYPYPARIPKGIYVEQLVGISTDEFHRAKDADVKYMRNRHPLPDLGWSRRDRRAKVNTPGQRLPFPTSRRRVVKDEVGLDDRCDAGGTAAELP